MYSIRVLLAEHDRRTDTEAHSFSFGVSEIHIHPQHTNRVKNYGMDMVMVKLATEIDFGSTINIRPICLPTSESELFIGRTVTVSGWGITDCCNLSPVLKFSIRHNANYRAL